MRTLLFLVATYEFSASSFLVLPGVPAREIALYPWLVHLSCIHPRLRRCVQTFLVVWIITDPPSLKGTLLLTRFSRLSQNLVVYLLPTEVRLHSAFLLSHIRSNYGGRGGEEAETPSFSLLLCFLLPSLVFAVPVSVICFLAEGDKPAVRRVPVVTEKGDLQTFFLVLSL